MPIIEDITFSGNNRLIIWEISETINELMTKVLLSDNSVKLLNLKKLDIHKKQFLAIRNILKELSIDDQDIVYEQSGKPFIRGSQSNLSFSHSGNYAAAILSDRDVVGIDLEKMSDRVSKIKSKYLETELNYPFELNTETSLVYWNIKESIFKAIDKPGIDFKKNILVTPLEIKKNVVKSWYIDDDKIYSFDTRFKISKKYTLAFVIKN